MVTGTEEPHPQQQEQPLPAGLHVWTHLTWPTSDLTFQTKSQPHLHLLRLSTQVSRLRWGRGCIPKVRARSGGPGPAWWGALLRLDSRTGRNLSNPPEGASTHPGSGHWPVPGQLQSHCKQKTRWQRMCMIIRFLIFIISIWILTFGGTLWWMSHTCHDMNNNFFSPFSIISWHQFWGKWNIWACWRTQTFPRQLSTSTPNKRCSTWCVSGSAHISPVLSLQQTDQTDHWLVLPSAAHTDSHTGDRVVQPAAGHHPGRRAGAGQKGDGGSKTTTWSRPWSADLGSGQPVGLHSEHKRLSAGTEIDSLVITDLKPWVKSKGHERVFVSTSVYLCLMIVMIWLSLFLLWTIQAFFFWFM